jgi:Zn-dependent protease with chaperone function
LSAAALHDAVVHWLEGIDVFIQNPAACSGVDLFRAWLALAIAFALVRLAMAATMFRPAAPVRDERLLRLYREAGALAGVAALPPLCSAEDGQTAAFTAGVRRQRVFASAELASLPDDELRVVFVHELTHVKRHDNLRAWWWNTTALLAPAMVAGGVVLYGGFVARLFRFANAEALWTIAALALWTLVAQRFITRELTLAREISCDAACADATGDPRLVASALLSVLRLQCGDERRGLFSSMAGAGSARRRIVTLLNPRARALRWWMTAAVQLTIAAFLLFVLHAATLRI